MIYLAQTDTTAGFLSTDKSEINLAKKRKIDQECIITSFYFACLKDFSRVHQKYKNQVRRAKKTTFIHKNNVSFRVIKYSKHSEFLKTFKFLYSSSANAHNKNFDILYAKTLANIVVDEDLSENTASKILKISKSKIKKIR